jgi:hypothetical protein
MFAEQALIYLHSRELLHIRAAKPRELTAKNRQFLDILSPDLSCAKFEHPGWDGCILLDN